MKIATLIFLFALEVSAQVLPSGRLVDWTNYPPGVQGGIPNYTTIFTNMSSIANVGTNVLAQIQNAINICPDGQVVYLPAGTYLITNTLNLQSGVVLRGAGMTNTMLVYSNGANQDAVNWAPSSTANIYYPNYAPANSNDVYSGAVVGATNLILLGGEPYTSGFVAGSLCLIDQTNDPAVFGNSIEHYDYMSRLGGSRMMKQMVQILSVSNGTNITFTPPLVWNYTNQPQMVYVPPTGVFSNSGIEQLCISNAWPVSTNSGGNINGNTVDFQQTVNCWAQNVEVARIAYSGINMYYAFHCTVDSCLVANAYQVQSSGSSYGMLIADGSSDNLIENSAAYGTENSIMITSCGARNVVAYNYIPYGYTWQPGSSGSGFCNHGGMPWFNLWEGNITSGFTADLFHGGSGYNILFRNWSKGWDPAAITTNGTILGGIWYTNAGVWNPDATNQYQRGVDLDASNRWYSIVGNVLGDPALQNPHATDAGKTNSWQYLWNTNDTANTIPYILRLGFNGTGYGPALFDDSVSNTAFINGNYDFANNATVWNSNGIQTLPASLWLTNRPVWWTNCGNSSPWPPIGPGATTNAAPQTNTIPAQVWFNQMMGLSGNAPPPPSIRAVNYFKRTTVIHAIIKGP